MAIANWNSRFETGIGSIDSQHQSLFEAMNKLADAYRLGVAKVQAEESLGFLVQYTHEHFLAEEKVMRDMDYPGLGPHMALHAELMEQAHAMQASHAQGSPTTMEVTIFLADWLKHHIHEADMDYVAFTREKTGSPSRPEHSS
jgi:hemerythrin-like metal-binding protein